MATVKVDYFRAIDTQIKAYLLGYLMADGCLYDKTGTPLLRVSMVEKDRAIMDLLVSEIESTYAVSIRKREKEQWQDQVQTMICNSEFNSHLMRWGITPGKTFDGMVPDEIIHSDMFSHYMRGYFDGDGTIVRSHSYYTYPFVSLCVNDPMTEQLMDPITEALGKSPYIYRKQSINKMNFQKRQAMTFLHWIYQDSEFHLNRKYDRYQFFVKHYENGGSPKIARPLRTAEWNRLFA